MSTNSSNAQETYLSTSEGGITPASVIAVGAVLAGLAVIAVALRFYVRLVRVRASLDISDWLILVSTFLTLGMGLMMIIGMKSTTPAKYTSEFYFANIRDSRRLCDGRLGKTDTSRHWAEGIPYCHQ